MTDIFNFLVSDDDNTARLCRLEIAGQLKSRPVDIGNDDPSVQRSFVACKLFKPEEINDLLDHYFLFIVIDHCCTSFVRL